MKLHRKLPADRIPLTDIYDDPTLKEDYLQYKNWYNMLVQGNIDILKEICPEYEDFSDIESIDEGDMEKIGY